MFARHEMKKFFNNMKKYHKYAVRSAKAELKSEVADSYLNWLWWIIEPLCFTLIYVFVFGYVFKNDTPYFASFVMLGLALWDFFSRMITGAPNLIINNRGLVTKVYIPKYILLYSKSLTYLFKMFISLGITFLLMIFEHVPLSWHMILIIPVIIVLYVVCFGISVFLMNYGVFLNDLSNLIRIFMKMIFYLAGLFYDLEARLSGILGYLLLRLNPIALFMQQARKVVIYNGNLDLEILGIWLIVGIIFCMLGIHNIHKNENSYAKVI